MPKIDDLMPLGQDPNLIGAIQRDVALAGLVGEEDAGLLVYLAYSSRKLPEPISVIVRGPSGSGKSLIQRTPASLMPPDDVADFTSVTPEAMYYGPPGSLANKVLMCGEESHQNDPAQKDKTKAIREMLSNHFITKKSVRDGEEVTLRQDGPVSYSATTTCDYVFKENLNRCLQVYANDGRELTDRVLAEMVERSAPGGRKLVEARKWAVESHQAFQDSLKMVGVVIPKIIGTQLRLAMPKDKVEVRRLFGNFLSLVKAVAFLHQHQRRPNAAGEVEAAAADVEVARRLMLGPLMAAVGSIGGMGDLGEMLSRLPTGNFTTADAQKAMGLRHRNATMDVLRQLQRVGAVELVKQGFGNAPWIWRKTGQTA